MGIKTSPNEFVLCSQFLNFKTNLLFKHGTCFNLTLTLCLYCIYAKFICIAICYQIQIVPVYTDLVDTVKLMLPNLSRKPTKKLMPHLQNCLCWEEILPEVKALLLFTCF